LLPSSINIINLTGYGIRSCCFGDLQTKGTGEYLRCDHKEPDYSSEPNYLASKYEPLRLLVAEGLQRKHFYISGYNSWIKVDFTTSKAAIVFSRCIPSIREILLKSAPRIFPKFFNTLHYVLCFNRFLWPDIYPTFFPAPPVPSLSSATWGKIKDKIDKVNRAPSISIVEIETIEKIRTEVWSFLLSKEGVSLKEKAYYYYLLAETYSISRNYRTAISCYNICFDILNKNIPNNKFSNYVQLAYELFSS